MKRQNFFNRISIFRKLMFSSVVVLICACLIVSSYLIRNTSLLLKENSLKRSEQEMNHIINGYTKALNEQYRVLQDITGYNLLTDYLEAEPDSMYEKYMEFTQFVSPWFLALRNANPKLDMKIYMAEDYRSIASVTGGQISQLENSAWWSSSRSGIGNDHVAFAHILVNTKYTDAVIYYRNVYDPLDEKVRRVVMVSQSSDDLRADIFVDDSWYYLINDEDQIVSTNDAETQGMHMDELTALLEIEDGMLRDGSVLWIQGRQYCIRREEIGLQTDGVRNGWYVLYLQSYDDIASEIRNQILQCIKISALIIMAALVIALSVAKSITDRLKLMMRKIDMLAAGDFSTQISMDGADELSQISRQFDEMRASVYRLIQARQQDYQEKLEYERRQKALIVNWHKMEYQALRAQINPHYLFNTLESIRMSLLLDKEREVARIIRMFSESMRRYMDAERTTAALEEELRYLQYYIEIQRFRRGEHVNYVERVEEALRSVQVPCLILQPLVENAFDHGIDRKVEGGTVVLDIHRENGWMVVQVSDDGAGMSAARLEEVRGWLKASGMTGEHLGLRNINRRLVLLFGEDGGMHIESEEGKGTTITVRFVIPEEGF